MNNHLPGFSGLMIDEQTARNNIADRELAETIVDLATNGGKKKLRPRFWEELAKFKIALEDSKLLDNKPLVSNGNQSDKMSYEEGMVYAATICYPSPSMHGGRAINDAPVKYMRYWIGGTYFTKELCRYVDSPHFLERVRKELEEEIALRVIHHEFDPAEDAPSR